MMVFCGNAVGGRTRPGPYYQGGPGRFHVEGRQMSWAITINDLDTLEQLPDEIYDSACAENPEYDGDARYAFSLAKARGLVTAAISGGRTPSPYGGPDTVTISIVGFNNRNEGHAVPPPASRDFNATMMNNILYGPDIDDDDGEIGMWDERL